MEKIKEAFHIAFSNLSSNMIRSALSILGIVIGIAAVITILALGAGARQEILNKLNSMGVNVYYVTSRYDEKTRRMGELDLDDIERLGKIPFVVTAFPQLNLYKEIRTRSANARGMVKGVAPSYAEANELKIVLGRNLSAIEMEDRVPVCLISDITQMGLFPDGNPLGQSLYIDGIPWSVIGVYATSARRKANRKDLLRDLEVLAPIPTLIRNTKDLLIQSVEVHVRPDAEAEAGKEILRVMERDDPKRKGLYLVRDQKELYAKSLEVQKILSMIGVLVAGVSLIVGGIGMMNVMLTSVAERTREIGVRRAVGARQKDILFQFLMESCVLSGIGGAMGLLLGAALARALPMLFREFFTVAPRIQPGFLVLSVGSGVILGIMFGYYPAVKASKLPPAEALRSE